MQIKFLGFKLKDCVYAIMDKKIQDWSEKRAVPRAGNSVGDDALYTGKLGVRVQKILNDGLTLKSSDEIKQGTVI